MLTSMNAGELVRDISPITHLGGGGVSSLPQVEGAPLVPLIPVRCTAAACRRLLGLHL